MTELSIIVRPFKLLPISWCRVETNILYGLLCAETALIHHKDRTQDRIGRFYVIHLLLAIPVLSNRFVSPVNKVIPSMNTPSEGLLMGSKIKTPLQAC